MKQFLLAILIGSYLSSSAQIDKGFAGVYVGSGLASYSWLEYDKRMGFSSGISWGANLAIPKSVLYFSFDNDRFFYHKQLADVDDNYTNHTRITFHSKSLGLGYRLNLNEDEGAHSFFAFTAPFGMSFIHLHRYAELSDGTISYQNPSNTYGKYRGMGFNMGIRFEYYRQVYKSIYLGVGYRFQLTTEFFAIGLRDVNNDRPLPVAGAPVGDPVSPWSRSQALQLKLTFGGG